MKVEIPVGYRVGEIANAASVLVDELTRTEIRGTEIWPSYKDSWIGHILGKRPLDVFDLTAQGLKLGYRGYLDNVDMMRLLGITLILDEPKLIVSADEKSLTPVEVASVGTVLSKVSTDYELANHMPPTTLVFPKIIYATELVVFDSTSLGLD